MPSSSHSTERCWTQRHLTTTTRTTAWRSVSDGREKASVDVDYVSASLYSATTRSSVMSIYIRYLLYSATVFFLSLATRSKQFSQIYSVSQKSSPPKTFCEIFTQIKYISVKFCQHVVTSYLHLFTNFGRLILIFNKMALIFLAVPIVFNVFSFKFH